VFGSPIDGLEPLLMKVIAQLGAFPVAALSFAARLPRKEVRPAESCPIQFEFKAAGGSKVEFANPRFHSDEVSGQISVELWLVGGREDAGELVLTLSSHDHEVLKTPREALPSNTPLLELQPTEALQVFLELKVPKLAAGDYVLQSSYSCTCDQPQKGVVTGVYAAEAVPFSVLPMVRK
jgi:hypothetical protein